jgi:hypothetical protein
MYLEESRFLSSMVKQEVAEEDTYEDAEEERPQQDTVGEQEKSIDSIAQKLISSR